MGYNKRPHGENSSNRYQNGDKLLSGYFPVMKLIPETEIEVSDIIK
jgi:hypothetical protein